MPPARGGAGAKAMTPARAAGRAGEPLLQRRAQHRLTGLGVLATTVDDQHRAMPVGARPEHEPLDGAQRLLARLPVKIETRLGAVVAPSQRAQHLGAHVGRAARDRVTHSLDLERRTGAAWCGHRSCLGRRAARGWRPGHPARAAFDAPGAPHRLLEGPGVVVVARRRRFRHRPPSRACGRCRSPDG